MGDTSERTRRRPAPADAAMAAGAAVVLALLAAAFVLVEPGSGPSVRSSFAWQPAEPPRAAQSDDVGVLPPAVVGLPEEAAPVIAAPAYARITGVARVSAYGPAGGGTRLRPVCDYAWAPQVRLDDGTPAVVSVPGVLSGLVVAQDRATWFCDYTYRADAPAQPAPNPRFDR